MEEYLSQLLKQNLDIPCYYITRRNNSKMPCIIYDFIETPHSSSDDLEETTHFEVFFNIFAESSEFITIKRNLMKILSNAGFNKKIVPQPVYMDDLDCFQQALQYSKILEYKI